MNQKVLAHHINGNSITAPFPVGYETAYFALGCFWGAEKYFWNIEGVYVTAVGYQGGNIVNPTYEQVCSGNTGHTETVMVVFDPQNISYEDLVKLFFQAHDPTQYMRQGNDIGTQYRSAIFSTSHQQYEIACSVSDIYNKDLINAGMNEIVTQIVDVPTPTFYYAEQYHQQYLSKNPDGYCDLRGTGIKCSAV